MSRSIPGSCCQANCNAAEAPVAAETARRPRRFEAGRRAGRVPDTNPIQTDTHPKSSGYAAALSCTLHREPGIAGRASLEACRREPSELPSIPSRPACTAARRGEGPSGPTDSAQGLSSLNKRARRIQCLLIRQSAASCAPPWQRGCLPLLSLAPGYQAWADETCNSPYMSNLIKGQEDFVYVWTLGVEGHGRRLRQAGDDRRQPAVRRATAR